MLFDYLQFYADPGLTHSLRAGNEARAAAIYARWRAFRELIAAAFRGLRHALWRSYRKRTTRRELQALSTRQLRDMGLRHTDIGWAAMAVATRTPQAGMTAAAVRRNRDEAGAEHDATIVRLPGSDAGRDHTAKSSPVRQGRVAG